MKNVSAKVLGVAVSNARLLGERIGELKNVEARRETLGGEISKLIKNARGEDKGKMWLAMLGASVKTCPIRQGFFDGCIAAKLSQKTAGNYFSLVKHCVESGAEFSFGLAKKLADAKKPKATKPNSVDVAPEVETIPPNAPPKAPNVSIHTPETIGDIVNQDVNNGPSVQAPPPSRVVVADAVNRCGLAIGATNGLIIALRDLKLSLMAEEAEAALEKLESVLAELRGAL